MDYQLIHFIKDKIMINFRDASIKLYGWYNEKQRKTIENKEILQWQKYSLKMGRWCNWKTNEFIMYCPNDKTACKVYHSQFNISDGYTIRNLTANEVLEDNL